MKKEQGRSEYTYGQPLKAGATPTYPRKRYCQAPGCSTRLSIYNSSLFCWLHDSGGPRPRHSPTRS
jgi:hypothetical protein